MFFLTLCRLRGVKNEIELTRDPAWELSPNVQRDWLFLNWEIKNQNYPISTTFSVSSKLSAFDTYFILLYVLILRLKNVKIGSNERTVIADHNENILEVGQKNVQSNGKKLT